jgi:hypothetical protein
MIDLAVDRPARRPNRQWAANSPVGGCDPLTGNFRGGEF